MITCTLAQSGLGRKLNTLCWHIRLQKAMKFWYYMEIFIPKPFHIALIKARKLLSLIHSCPETEDFCSSSGSCRCHAKIVMYIIPGQSSIDWRRPCMDWEPSSFSWQKISEMFGEQMHATTVLPQFGYERWKASWCCGRMEKLLILWQSTSPSNTQSSAHTASDMYNR